MANQFLPGGLAQRAIQSATKRPRSVFEIMQPRNVYSSAGQVDIRNAFANAPGMFTEENLAKAAQERLAATKRTQADVLKSYGLGAPAPKFQAAVEAPTQEEGDAGLMSMLPAAGTPEMAGIGAAGREILKYSGWQDQPISLGQILGAGAEKGIAAMRAQRKAELNAAEKKAAAERQAKLDELNRRNIESQIAAREKEAPFKPGTPFEVQTPNGKMKAIWGPDNKLIYVGEVIKPDEKAPGLPQIGATRTMPLGGRMTQKQEYKKLDDGSYGWVNFGKPESLDAPGTAAALKKPYPVDVIVNGQKGTVRKIFVGFGAKGADENGEITVANSFVPNNIKVSDLEPIDDFLLVNGERSSAKVYRKVSPDGSEITVIEDRSSKNGFRPLDINSDELVPKDDRWQEEFMDKKYEELSGHERGLKMFEKMSEALDSQEAGLKGALVKLSADIKTIAGNKNLTTKEKHQQLVKGMQQGLLGQIRVDILGPGVMTEQDAVRLVQYLGGDLNNLTTNPTVVKDAVDRVISLKIQEFNRLIPRYNRQQQLFGAKSGYPKFEQKIDIDEALEQY